MWRLTLKEEPLFALSVSCAADCHQRRSVLRTAIHQLVFRLGDSHEVCVYLVFLIDLMQPFSDFACLPRNPTTICSVATTNSSTNPPVHPLPVWLLQRSRLELISSYSDVCLSARALFPPGAVKWEQFGKPLRCHRVALIFLMLPGRHTPSTRWRRKLPFAVNCVLRW